MFEGIFPPIATPFKDDELDVDALARNVARWAETGLAGLVVLGSNGENVLMTDEERELAIRTVVDVAPPSMRILVGTGRESTRETIRATERAAKLGAHGALVINPLYYKAQYDHTALFEHYRAVAAASPIPVLLYNLPSATGLNLSADLVVRCAAEPKIVGVKDSSGNIVQIAEIIRQAPAGFSTFAGSGSFLYASLCLGAAGGIVALANVAPRECVALYNAVRAGDHESARRLQLRLMAVNAAVTSRFGVPGLKAAMDLVGYEGGEPRRPLRPLDPQQRDEVRRILAAAELLPAASAAS